MKLIINIPDELYNRLREDHSYNSAKIAYRELMNGKPYEERPQGEWIDPKNVGANNWCSVCGEFILHYNGIHNYCSNCGAQMVGGGENE